MHRMLTSHMHRRHTYAQHAHAQNAHSVRMCAFYVMCALCVYVCILCTCTVCILFICAHYLDMCAFCAYVCILYICAHSVHSAYIMRILRICVILCICSCVHCMHMCGFSKCSNHPFHFVPQLCERARNAIDPARHNASHIARGTSFTSMGTNQCNLGIDWQSLWLLARVCTCNTVSAPVNAGS